MEQEQKEGAVLEVGGLSTERPNLIILTAWVIPEALGVASFAPGSQADLLKQRLKALAIAAIENPQAWIWK